MNHVIVTTPLSGRFVIRRLGLATIKICTEFELSISTHYENTKGDSKYRQEGQHPLAGQRAANFRRDLEAT